MAGNFRDVKLLGIVKSIDDRKNCGMIECNEALLMWSCDVYAYKDVLSTVGANVGDAVRFGIHLNNRGQPQASLPIYKVDSDGVPMGVKPDETVINAEDLLSEDPNFLDTLRQAITERSREQNENRKRRRLDNGTNSNQRWCDAPQWNGPVPTGGGQRWNTQPWLGNMGMMNLPGSGQWGGGCGCSGGGWGNQGVDLFVGGVPAGVTTRELRHIFRQYAGFISLRTADREDHTLVFVTFATPAQAQFVADALDGYVFDDELPEYEQCPIQVQFAKTKRVR